MIQLESYLEGAWRKGSGNTENLTDPSTGEVIAELASGGLDRKAALMHARHVGGPALRALTFAERGAMLRGLSKALAQKRDALIDDSMLNLGTPRGDAKFDIDGAIGTLAYYGSLGRSLGDRTFLLDGESEQLSQSARFFGRHIRVSRHGAAIHINAFNFPAWGLAEKAACAWLAGMPVLTKPASSTALLAYRVAQVLVESRALPEGAFSILCASAGDLLDHVATQDVIAFTGSAVTGAKIRSHKQVVERSVPVNVEADSLNAAVLGIDVEPGSDTYQMFVRQVAREITQKCGQKCTATRRVFIPKEKLEQVQAALIDELSRTKAGDPRNDEVRLGPLVSPSQLRDVREGIEAFEAAGLQMVLDGRKPALTAGSRAEGCYVGPTLFVASQPSEAGLVHQREVFGPVCTLMPYETPEEALNLVALGEGSLLTSLYSDDRDFLATLMLGVAPYSGRVYVGSKKVADQATPPGAVLPSCVHGGPGRAGGGEELGGVRGLSFYMQRTAFQGDRALLDKLLDVPKSKEA